MKTANKRRDVPIFYFYFFLFAHFENERKARNLYNIFICGETAVDTQCINNILNDPRKLFANHGSDALLALLLYCCNGRMQHFFFFIYIEFFHSVFFLFLWFCRIKNIKFFTFEFRIGWLSISVFRLISCHSRYISFIIVSSNSSRVHFVNFVLVSLFDSCGLSGISLMFAKRSGLKRWHVIIITQHWLFSFLMFFFFLLLHYSLHKILKQYIIICALHIE